MAISASTRISIRWPPAPASEPTDTLVLSVNGYYVDLRVLKSDQSIDWALAGQRIVLQEDPLKVKFTHPLDSHLDGVGESEDEPEPDIGDFTELPNGDKLETGQMAAPHLDGRIMPYEEIWRSLDFTIDLEHGDIDSEMPSAFVLESTNSEPSSGHGQHDVYEHDTTMSHPKTYYARAGRLFLGVRQRLADAEAGTRPMSTNLLFDAIRQDFDIVERRWNTKYSIGRTEDMWNMNSTKPKHKWTLGNKISLDNNEVCIVRAVAES